MITKTNPQAVSRALHRIGYPTVPDHTWQGLRVTKSWGGRVSVWCQFDGERKSHRTAQEVAEELRAVGYAAEARESFVEVEGRVQ